MALAAGSTSQAAIVASDKAETLIRVRGDVAVWLDATGSAIGDLVQVAWGLIVAPRGSTVGSLPISDGNANWLAYGTACLFTELALATRTTWDEGMIRRFLVDNKAMRKLREDEDVFFIVQTADVVGAAAVNIAASLRFLTGE